MIVSDIVFMFSAVRQSCRGSAVNTNIQPRCFLSSVINMWDILYYLLLSLSTELVDKAEALQHLPCQHLFNVIFGQV